METTILGRTELRVSRMGLGCGGHSRLGLSGGGDEAGAERVVREALALGINLIDTAEAYGTEEIVGRALTGGSRDEVVLSTKVGPRWKDRLSGKDELKERVEAGLTRLRTDRVEILHMHGVSVDDYPHVREELIPAIEELRSEGKVRFAGITEAFASDPSHRMLPIALRDDFWDVVMVGFNLINQSARERVLSLTREKDVGTLCMFAVRRALSRPEALRDVVRELADAGLVDDGGLDPENPLGFVVENGAASSVTDGAYRFCRWEPGIDVVLSGTGSVEHLRENYGSLSRPPLPADVVDRLRRLFARVDTVSGN